MKLRFSDDIIKILPLHRKHIYIQLCILPRVCFCSWLPSLVFAEEHLHLFQGHALGFRHEKVEEQPSPYRYTSKHKKKAPPMVIAL